MKQPAYPSLYQINTRVWLTEMSADPDHRATIDDIPDDELDELQNLGFDWIWFLSVWRTGEHGRKVSRENPDFRREFALTLPDLCEDDIAGSGFAITDYHVHPGLGGDKAIKRLRDRLHKRGLKLMLDFVPNHMGADHAWVENHPDYFIKGTAADLEKYPQNYTRLKVSDGETIFAYGRDPYFAGWPDTLQLDYSNPSFVNDMLKELLHLAELCDGVRCDMAMLILPEIFERTWGRAVQPFWSLAIQTVREKFPDFIFLAEVYWDMEWTMQQEGFDYTYDKKLYDRLRDGEQGLIRGHFGAAEDYQEKLARFLENHDEPRAASTFDQKKHEAAALITFLSPGLRFFHQGQFEGRTKRISPHLIRAPKESPDKAIQKFYIDLLAVIQKPVFRNGRWQLLNAVPAWEGNPTHHSFLVFAWEDWSGERALVIVNYAPHASQCFVHLPFSGLGGRLFQFRDLMSASVYERNGDDLLARGLYLDLPAWGYHVFEVSERNTTEETKEIVTT
jgi:Alpha amylase, catalytic domain